MKMQLEVGKYYRSRNGDSVLIVAHDPSAPLYQFTDDCGSNYMNNGRVHNNIENHPYDLVEELPSEPSGRARKDDVKDGKVGRAYMHPRTRDELELAHEAGAVKYGPLNFMDGHTTTQLLSAAIRHLEKHLWEGDLDEDCTQRLGRPVMHLGCALAGINMLLAQIEAGTHLDDRQLERRKGKKS
jgi:hypothetical protein